MERIPIIRLLLLTVALISLMIGCGGDKGTETSKDNEKKGDQGSGAQGSGEKAGDLATFLSGKQISFSVRDPEAPVEVPEQTMLVQFDADGTLTIGTVLKGKAVAVTDNKPPFKVDGLKVTMPDPFKKGEISMTFSSANPKAGDKFTIHEPGNPQAGEKTISAIEKAGKLEMMALPANPEPGDPDPEGIDGNPAFGIGPNGGVAKSKHPSFMAHNWKTDQFSRGPKHIAAFGKDGTLTITPDKGKPAKGTWEVAGAVITLTYPNAETGKEQSLKYRFLFGGSEVESSDGGVEKFETLNLVPELGKNHPGISYQRPLPSDGGRSKK